MEPSLSSLRAVFLLDAQGDADTTTVRKLRSVGIKRIPYNFGMRRSALSSVFADGEHVGVLGRSRSRTGLALWAK